MDIEVQPDDRILLLSIADLSAVRSLVARAAQGLVVGLGTDEEVRAARKTLRDLETVMFVLQPENGSIPWQESFFSRVIAPQHTEASPEFLRVLVPGGTLHLAGGRQVTKS